MYNFTKRMSGFIFCRGHKNKHKPVRHIMMWLREFLRLKMARFQFIFTISSLLFVVFICKQVLDESLATASHQKTKIKEINVIKSESKQPPTDLVTFKSDTPLIWIGGVPRSGTTLLRVMLDAHPDIRCGAETRVIPRILGMFRSMERSDSETEWLREANITNSTLDNALGAFILSIIANHGERVRLFMVYPNQFYFNCLSLAMLRYGYTKAHHLCSKDPFTLRSIDRLLRIFPNSRFLLVIRDGRAVVHSIISRQVNIKGFDCQSYSGGLKDWNRVLSSMYSLCMSAGHERCLPVYYERLVLDPEPQIRDILSFLGIPWDPSVLHHQETIGKNRGAVLSRKEYSTDQVIRPINTDSLHSWAQYIPHDVRTEIRTLAPMLEALGYDPDAYPPDYSRMSIGEYGRLPFFS